MSKVIVIGGGLAGLSAAHTILENGGSVLLLDKSAFLGGNSTKATSGINGKRFLFLCFKEISLFLRLFLCFALRQLDRFFSFLSFSFFPTKKSDDDLRISARTLFSFSLSFSLSLFGEKGERHRDTIIYKKARALPFSREKIRFLTEI